MRNPTNQFILTSLLLLLVGCASAPPKEESAKEAAANEPSMVVFLSDYGTAGESVSLCKAAMYRVEPHLRIVDVSHDSALSILDGARYLTHNASYYPPETVFVGVVEPAKGNPKIIAVRTKKGQYFVLPDNGLISILATAGEIEQAREISKDNGWVTKRKYGATVFGADVLCPVAAHLARHQDWKRVGPVVKEVERLSLPLVTYGDNALVGQVIGVEGNYGNVVSNIEATDFLDLGYVLGDVVDLKVGEKEFKVRFAKGFSQVPEKGLLIFVDGSGKMVLAINGGNFGRTYHITPPIPFAIARKPLDIKAIANPNAQ